MDYNNITDDELELLGETSNGGSTASTPDLFSIPDAADPTELKRIAETAITEGHAEKTRAKIGLRQPDDPPESTGPGLNLEEQPKLANQHDGMPPNISSNPANSQHAAKDFERRVENSEVSEQLIYQNANQLTAEKRSELLNKATNKKSFNPQLTR
jgi:hypothetical protein